MGPSTSNTRSETRPPHLPLLQAYGWAVPTRDRLSAQFILTASSLPLYIQATLPHSALLVS